MWRPLVLSSMAMCVAVVCAHGSAQQQSTPGKRAKRPGDRLLGEWWTEGREGRIRFTRYKDGTFRGKTTCCAKRIGDERRILRDVHNPNPELRSRPRIGIVIIWELSYEGDGEYSGGYVYNPRDGHTYRFKAELLGPNTLRIRGYAGIPLLGQSQTWKRARGVIAGSARRPPRTPRP